MLYSIQFCRAVAAILVVLFHAAASLSKDKYFGAAASNSEWFFRYSGAAGVNFFFVLSGFIIHQIHNAEFGHPRQIGSFIFKRASRIYPVYWIIFGLVCLAAWALPASRGIIPSDPLVFIKGLLLVPQDGRIVGGTGAPIIEVAWTLQYEVFFYLIFSLAFFSRYLFYTACVVLSAFVAFPALVSDYGYTGQFISRHLILLFGIGILASVAVINSSSIRSKRIFWSAPLASMIGVYYFATQFRTSSNEIFIDLVYGILSGTLIYGLVLNERKNGSSLLLKKVSILGDASYSLYLMHFPLLAIICKVCVKILPLTPGGSNIAVLIAASVSIVISLLFHVVIERPILKRIKKVAKIPTPSRPISATT